MANETKKARKKFQVAGSHQHIICRSFFVEDFWRLSVTSVQFLVAFTFFTTTTTKEERFRCSFLSFPGWDSSALALAADLMKQFLGGGFTRPVFRLPFARKNAGRWLVVSMF
eukprot:scaffold5506_cov159-Amphora_coffeaeformis.AAC.4